MATSLTQLEEEVLRSSVGHLCRFLDFSVGEVWSVRSGSDGKPEFFLTWLYTAETLVIEQPGGGSSVPVTLELAREAVDEHRLATRLCEESSVTRSIKWATASDVSSDGLLQRLPFPVNGLVSIPVPHESQVLFVMICCSQFQLEVSLFIHVLAFLLRL